jgi:aldehyde dehydrogenase (NAD+)
MSGTTLSSTDSIRERALASLRRVGVTVPEGDGLTARTPITGQPLFELAATTAEETGQAVTEAAAAFRAWRTTPAPDRGSWCGDWAICCARTRAIWRT